MATPCRSVNWVFTLNNPPAVFSLERTFADAKYGVGQLEVGESGTRHFQGYVIFESRKSLDQVKVLLPGAHWEVRRGSHAQAKTYCTKVDTRLVEFDIQEFGIEPLGRGSRSDLVSIKEKLDDGVSEADIADEHFGSWVRYHKSFREYRNVKTALRNFLTRTTVYWGEPGTGKTRRAFEEAGADAYWLAKPNGTRVFWDGYTGQTNVVIDEFFGWMPRDLMCRICDRYVTGTV